MKDKFTNKVMDKYKVTIIDGWDLDVGECIKEVWSKNFSIQKKDGPAIIYKSRDGSKILKQEWYEKGVLSRGDDLPAVIIETDHVSEERYYLNGKLHRDHNDLPAIIAMDKCRNNGIRLEWYQEGLEHRLDGPSYVFINAEKQIFAGEVYKIAGEFRDHLSGPGAIERDTKTGVPWLVSYFKDGERHRDDGLPAIEFRDRETGEIIEDECEYYEFGKKIQKNKPVDPSP